MTDEGVRRAADAVGVPLAMSLAPWGVVKGSLELADDESVVCLTVATELQRVVLQAQVWLLPQVRILLVRMGVPPPTVMAARLRITSEEAVQA